MFFGTTTAWVEGYGQAHSWRMHFEGAAVEYAAGDQRGSLQATMEQVFTFGKNKDARLVLSRRGSYEQALVAANLYF